MLNTDLHLHFDTLDATKLPTQSNRDGFGRGLVEAAEADERIVVLCGDVTESTRTHWFKERFPERYIEVGIAEQHMAALASGLAAAGKIPFIVSYAVFSPGRNWEQIRTTIALNDVPVKIVGSHTGVSAGPDGATHQALEDITLMRVLPNISIVIPADAEEARKATLAVARTHAPAYIRLSRSETPVFTTPETPFALGKADYLWHSDNSEVAIIGAGPILYDALMAARQLADEGLSTSVLNVHSIKSMDIDAVLGAVRECGALVSVEDHQILGGIGGTLAEIVTQNTPCPIEMISVHDKFGQSGTPEELKEHYGLSVSAIVNAVTRVRGRKAK